MRSMMVAAALAALLAGCGGADDSRPTATTATPVTYSVDQLRQALPAASELPVGLSDLATCPSDDEDAVCAPDSVDRAYSVNGRIEPASPQGAEAITNPSVPGDFFAIDVIEVTSAAAAEKQETSQLEDLQAYEGEYRVEDQKVGSGKAPDSQGVGSTRQVRFGQWTGYADRRTARSLQAPASDQGLLVAGVSLRSGTSIVKVFVSMSAADREGDAAVDLADTLMRDYLKRLSA